MVKMVLADLIEIQRQSFHSLLRSGIPEEFMKRNPITNFSKTIEIWFYPHMYKLSQPEKSIKQCLQQSKSYSAKLYMPLLFINKPLKKIQLKWALIGHLPLMTKRGHFILNGSARLILNQMIRSPGIYFGSKLHEVYQTVLSQKPTEIYQTYYADFIPLKGTWLRLEIDKDKKLWAQFKKGPKMPAFLLCLAMGYTEKQIYGLIPKTQYLVKSFEPEDSKKTGLKWNYVQTQNQAFKALASSLGKNVKITNNQQSKLDFGRQWIFKRFMNPRLYDLGAQGRLCLNQKLGCDLPLSITNLTPIDLCFAINQLIRVEEGFFPIDDIDHLKNRRVRTSGECIRMQIGLGLLRLEKYIRDKINRSKLPRSSRALLTTKALNGVLREFFGTSPLSQFMDQINPLSELTHKRRLTSLGPGGVSRDNATLAIRGIHPTHYGRICPVETPEGKNTGLVNSLTTYARVQLLTSEDRADLTNQEGLLYTPFFKVYKGQVQKNLGFFFFTAEEEEKIGVATPDLLRTSLEFLPCAHVPIRFGQHFLKESRQNIRWFGVSPTQMISLATSLIPFLEHDDANRALMGSNMQRQAVPVLRPERPIVGTGFEARAASDSGHLKLASRSGIVAYVSSKQMVIYS